MINIRGTKTGRQKIQILIYKYTNKPRIRTVIIIEISNQYSYTARIN